MCGVGGPATVQGLDEPAHVSTLPCVREQSPIASVISTGLLRRINASNVTTNALLPVFDNQEGRLCTIIRPIHNTGTDFVYGGIIA
jgi:hypothetical protein